MANSISTTELAISAFRQLERANLNAELASHKLSGIIGRNSGHIDMQEYYSRTEAIRQEFEKKRTEFVQIGRLPLSTYNRGA